MWSEFLDKTTCCSASHTTMPQTALTSSGESQYNSKVLLWRYPSQLNLLTPNSLLCRRERRRWRGRELQEAQYPRRRRRPEGVAQSQKARDVDRLPAEARPSEPSYSSAEPRESRTAQPESAAQRPGPGDSSRSPGAVPAGVAEAPPRGAAQRGREASRRSHGGAGARPGKGRSLTAASAGAGAGPRRRPGGGRRIHVPSGKQDMERLKSKRESKRGFLRIPLR